MRSRHAAVACPLPLLDVVPLTGEVPHQPASARAHDLERHSSLRPEAEARTQGLALLELELEPLAEAPLARLRPGRSQRWCAIAEDVARCQPAEGYQNEQEQCGGADTHGMGVEAERERRGPAHSLRSA